MRGSHFLCLPRLTLFPVWEILSTKSPDNEIKENQCTDKPCIEINHTNENNALENTDFADKLFLHLSTNLKVHMAI